MYDLPETGKGPEEKRKTSFGSRIYISGVTGQYHKNLAGNSAASSWSTPPAQSTGEPGVSKPLS